MKMGPAKTESAGTLTTAMLYGFVRLQDIGIYAAMSMLRFASLATYTTL